MLGIEMMLNTKFSSPDLWLPAKEVSKFAKDKYREIIREKTPMTIINTYTNNFFYLHVCKYHIYTAFSETHTYTEN